MKTNSIVQTDIPVEEMSLAQEMLLNRKMIGKQKGLITLELWSYEADILMAAIVSRQMELTCRSPHKLDYSREEFTLGAIESELIGQLRMLDLIKRNRDKNADSSKGLDNDNNQTGREKR